MKNKKFILAVLGTIVVTALATVLAMSGITLSEKTYNTQTVSLRSVGQAIIGQGEIHSQQEAALHFQTAGKLVYLPFKEGDAVYTGQTIGQLDTYPLQQQLSQALNAYKISRDNFDQTQDNIASSVIQGQQKANLEGKNLGMPTTSALNADDNLSNTIANIVKRIADQSQAGLDNAVINVQLANYAMQLASLQVPFDGVITHMDASAVNENITPATSFTIADPNHLIFKTTISSRDIDFVTVGSVATISLTGSNSKISGVVAKIYPQRITTASGDDVYQVDIAADGLQGLQLGQTGVVSIASSNTKPTVVVPTWVIVGHNSIWVLDDNKPVLKQITIGPAHGDATEIYAGLTNGEKIILNPQSIAAGNYISL